MERGQRGAGSVAYFLSRVPSQPRKNGKTVKKTEKLGKPENRKKRKKLEKTGKTGETGETGINWKKAETSDKKPEKNWGKAGKRISKHQSMSN